MTDFGNVAENNKTCRFGAQKLINFSIIGSNVGDNNLSGSISDIDSAPKLLSGTGKENIHLCVVMTSDRGLCGGFNANIIKKAKSYFSKIINGGKELKIITVGSKGNDQLKRAYGSYIIEKVF